MSDPFILKLIKLKRYRIKKILSHSNLFNYLRFLSSLSQITGYYVASEQDFFFNDIKFNKV